MTLVLIGLAVVIAVVLDVAATRPGTFRVERSTTIQAPPETVYPLIDDFHAWAKWSPWEELDPNMKKSFGGPARGAGSFYEWEGNKKVGAGRMEILKAVPATALSIKLDFLRPFEGHNVADFTLVPGAGSTQVTWAVHGPMVFMGKVMSLFISMDSLMGKDFAKGLAKMKSVAEG